jgi:uncharacterized membrane protein
MATLLAITYADSDRANKAMGSVDWSHFDRLIDVKAACLITNENGETKVHPRGQHTIGKAAAAGALGLLVGGILGAPVVGIAAATGAVVGIRKKSQKEVGIDDDFLKSIGDQVDAGGSALVLLFEGGADNAKAAADLAQFGGKVHSTDLAPETLARFQTLLDRANQTPATSSESAIAEQTPPQS